MAQKKRSCRSIQNELRVAREIIYWMRRGYGLENRSMQQLMHRFHKFTGGYYPPPARR